MRADKQSIYHELLVLRCQRGDKDALEELIRSWENRLFYYVRRVVDEEQDARDVLQKTWIKMLRKIGSLREPRALPTWLYRIARNTAITHCRIESSNRAMLDESEHSCSVEDNTEEFSLEDAEQVHYGLSRLSLPHREVLTLHFLQDLSVEQIADVIGVCPGTVKSRLHYARRALRRVLDREDQDDE